MATTAAAAPRSIAAGALALALLSGCGDDSSDEQGAETSKTALASAEPSVPVATPQPLTAFGATRAAWDKAHEAAPGYAKGTSYLPFINTIDGSVPMYGGVMENARGIIDEYLINVPANTSLASARTMARLELGDATLGTGFRQGDRATRCTFFIVEGAELRKVLRGVPVVIIYNFEDGIPGVEYIALTTFDAVAAVKRATC